jgi:hypothetical protein
VTAEAGVIDYESWASRGWEWVTRGPLGWSKTTPPFVCRVWSNVLKIVDAGRKRHGTSLLTLNLILSTQKLIWVLQLGRMVPDVLAYALHWFRAHLTG